MFGPVTPMTVTAGTFNTLEMRATAEYLEPNDYGDLSISSSAYYGEDVGLIKRFVPFVSTGNAFIYELVSYNLN